MSITSSYFLRNFSTTSCFEGNSILYNFMSHKNVQKRLHLEGMGQNITGPFQSQQKSTFCFEDILSMVTPTEMKPKRLFIGLLDLSKKSKNTQKWGKLSKIHLVQVGHFWRIAQREILTKIKIFANGPAFFSFNLVP